MQRTHKGVHITERVFILKHARLKHPSTIRRFPDWKLHTSLSKQQMEGNSR